jgi:hypothetical protein
MSARKRKSTKHFSHLRSLLRYQSDSASKNSAYHPLFVCTEVQVYLCDHDTIQHDVKDSPYTNSLLLVYLELVLGNCTYEDGPQAVKFTSSSVTFFLIYCR